MQVFVPMDTLSCSAWVLDKARAGNQCWRESVTLYKGGWPNHPASKLFADYPAAMCDYNVALIEMINYRGWCSSDTYNKWLEYWTSELAKHGDVILPPWWGDEEIHSSHRAVLLHKNYKWYSQFGWKETPLPPDPVTKRFGYVWPY